MSDKKIEIGEVAELNPRLKIESRPHAKEMISFVPMAAVSEVTKRIENPIDRAYSEVANGFTSFQRGDILVAKITPCFENGKIAYANTLPRKYGFGSTEFHVLRPGDQLDGGYLYHLLREPYVRRAGQIKMKGAAGQKRVPAEFFANLRIPFPPLEEQERIAAILDAADALRAKRRESIEQLESLVQSVFLDMFGDPVTNPKGWEIGCFSDVVERLDGGRNVAEADQETDFRVLKVSSVTYGEFRPEESKYLPADFEVRESYLVEKDDLLISRANTRELIGATAYVWDTPNNIVLPDKIWKFVWKNDAKIEPIFIYHLSQTHGFRNSLRSRATGTSGSMKNIAKPKLLSLPIPLPPVDLQRQFKTIVETVRSQKNHLELHLKELDLLFASLQSLAFKGELIL